MPTNYSPTGLTASPSISPSGKGINNNVKLRARNLNGYGNYTSNSTQFMVWASTPSMTESNVSSISGGYSGRNTMIRVSGFSAADTPSYTAADFYSTAAWNSSAAAAAHESILIPHSSGDRFAFDQTNWQTYLPGLTANANRTGSPATQYITFCLSKTNVSSFTLTLSGVINGMWCAFPGSGDGLNTTDSASSLNGWLDVSANFAGAGLPGSNTGVGGNGSNGIRNPSSPGTAPGSFAGQTLNNSTFNISLGTCDTANGSAHNHPILIRIALTSGQYLTSISFS